MAVGKAQAIAWADHGPQTGRDAGDQARPGREGLSREPLRGRTIPAEASTLAWHAPSRRRREAPCRFRQKAGRPASRCEPPRIRRVQVRRRRVRIRRCGEQCGMSRESTRCRGRRRREHSSTTPGPGRERSALNSSSSSIRGTSSRSSRRRWSRILLGQGRPPSQARRIPPRHRNFPLPARPPCSTARTTQSLWPEGRARGGCAGQCVGGNSCSDARAQIARPARNENCASRTQRMFRPADRSPASNTSRTAIHYTNPYPNRPLMHRCPCVISTSMGDVTFTMRLSCAYSVSVHPTPQ